MSVGSVDVSGSFEIVVKANTNRRQVLQQWASITGAEISYVYTQVNFKAHVGSSTAVELSEKENVKGLTIQLDSNSDSVSYSVELSRLQHLSLGDAVHIDYSTLEVDETTRVISLDYDVFHPWNISMQCGDYVPTYYEAVQDSIEDMEEEINEEIPSQVDSALGLALVRASRMDFSNWDNGSFYEILDNGLTVNYTVLFDALDRPILIVDGTHSCVIAW